MDVMNGEPFAPPSLLPSQSFSTRWKKYPPHPPNNKNPDFFSERGGGTSNPTAVHEFGLFDGYVCYELGKFFVRGGGGEFADRSALKKKKITRGSIGSLSPSLLTLHKTQPTEGEKKGEMGKREEKKVFFSV